MSARVKRRACDALWRVTQCARQAPMSWVPRRRNLCTDDRTHVFRAPEGGCGGGGADADPPVEGQYSGGFRAPAPPSLVPSGPAGVCTDPPDSPSVPRSCPVRDRTYGSCAVAAEPCDRQFRCDDQDSMVSSLQHLWSLFGWGNGGKRGETGGNGGQWGRRDQGQRGTGWGGGGWAQLSAPGNCP